MKAVLLHSSCDVTCVCAVRRKTPWQKLKTLQPSSTMARAFLSQRFVGSGWELQADSLTGTSLKGRPPIGNNCPFIVQPHLCTAWPNTLAAWFAVTVSLVHDTLHHFLHTVLSEVKPLTLSAGNAGLGQLNWPLLRRERLLDSPRILTRLAACAAQTGSSLPHQQLHHQ